MPIWFYIGQSSVKMTFADPHHEQNWNECPKHLQSPHLDSHDLHVSGPNGGCEDVWDYEWKCHLRSNTHNFDILAKHSMEKNEVEILKLPSIITVCSNNIRAKSKDAILSEINQISSYQALFRPKSLQ